MIYKELNAEEESKEVEKIKASAVTVEKGATLAMTLKKIQSSALPLYTAIPKNCTETKTRGFLEVQHNGETKYIRKSTVVWLHNEGERVSTDRLFRALTTQPFSGYDNPTCKATSSNQGLIQSEMISVGNMCIFIVNEATKEFDIGKVLQFAYYKEKIKRQRSTQHNMPVQPVII